MNEEEIKEEELLNQLADIGWGLLDDGKTEKLVRVHYRNKPYIIKLTVEEVIINE